MSPRRHAVTFRYPDQILSVAAEAPTRWVVRTVNIYCRYCTRLPVQRRNALADFPDYQQDNSMTDRVTDQACPTASDCTNGHCERNRLCAVHQEAHFSPVVHVLSLMRHDSCGSP